MQIMTPEQAKNYRFDILDITKVWPMATFHRSKWAAWCWTATRLTTLPKWNRLPLSGQPGPGIAASPDKMLQARLFSYHDTHLHRWARTITCSLLTPPGMLRTQLSAGRFHAFRRQRRRRANYWPTALAVRSPKQTPPNRPSGLPAKPAGLNTLILTTISFRPETSTVMS